MKDIYDIAYEISNLINEWGYKDKTGPDSEVDVFHLLQYYPRNDKDVEDNLLAVDCLKKLKVLHSRDISVPYVDDDLIKQLKDQIKLYKKLKKYDENYRFSIVRMVDDCFDLAIKYKSINKYVKAVDARYKKYEN